MHYHDRFTTKPASISNKSRPDRSRLLSTTCKDENWRNNRSQAQKIKPTKPYKCRHNCTQTCNSFSSSKQVPTTPRIHLRRPRDRPAEPGRKPKPLVDRACSSICALDCTCEDWKAAITTGSYTEKYRAQAQKIPSNAHRIKMKNQIDINTYCTNLKTKMKKI